MFTYKKIKRRINIYASHSLFRPYLRFATPIVDNKNFIYGHEICLSLK